MATTSHGQESSESTADDVPISHSIPEEFASTPAAITAESASPQQQSISQENVTDTTTMTTSLELSDSIEIISLGQVRTLSQMEVEESRAVPLADEDANTSSLSQV